MSRTTGFSVALVGSDGAGKSTVSRRLERTFPLPIKYIYMGVNLDSTHLVLPTTRLILEIKRALGRRPAKSGPPDRTQVRPRPKSVVKRAALGLKSSLLLLNLMAEEWFRQGLTWYYQSRGYIVLFDRHFFLDYYFHDVVYHGSERQLARRVHGFVLERFYPRPDLVICLDAPAELLYERKPEGTLAALERRRQEYLQLQDVVDHFITVDATQREDKVVHQVAELICDFSRAKTGDTRARDGNLGY